jgi:glycosyltransferase involved in cell wall biosynthesis
MLVVHRLLRTWHRRIHRYIACTDHGKGVLVRGGLPADRIAVKPNFIDPLPETGEGTGGYALFVGRLSSEKGVEQMLAAWRRMPVGPTLKIVGDGSLRPLVERAAQDSSKIEYLGWQSRAEVDELMREAACLMLPSLWFEGFPKTQLEAMALGTPTLASNLGSMSETIKPWKNGLHFTPGDVDAICGCVSLFFTAQDRWHGLRASTREEFLNHYTAETNYQQLHNIYQAAIESSLEQKRE